MKSPDRIMERTLEAVLTGDKSMMLLGVLEAKSYQHGLETLEALFNIELNKPMAHGENIDVHLAWPEDW